MSDSRNYSDVLADVAVETAATSDEIRRLRLRFAPDSSRSRAQKRPWYELPTVLAAACALVFAIIVAASPWLEGLRGDEISWELASTQPTTLPVGHLISLVHTGTGLVEGTYNDLSIAWDDGLLDIDVVPDRGVRVAIDTTEAHVRVVGTRLTVERGDLSTSVAVQHGLVAVTCLDHLGRTSPTVEVGAGADHRCRSTDPDEVHALAVQLRQDGEDPERIVELAAHGLELVDDGPVYFELLADSIAPLIEVDRKAEAIDAIERYLEGGDLPRAGKYRQLLENLKKDGSLEE